METLSFKDQDTIQALHFFAKAQFRIPDFDVLEDELDAVYEFQLTSSFPLQQLQKELISKLNRYGFRGFTDLYSETDEKVPYYGGLGVTYNPNYIDPRIHPLHQVLGAPRKNLANFFVNSEAWSIYDKILKAQKEKIFFYDLLNNPSDETLKQFSELTEDEVEYLRSFLSSHNFVTFEKKNSYSDSWRFHLRTELAESGHLKQLLDHFPFSVVRSRLAVLKPEHIKGEQDLKKLWHRDEDPLLEARLVIPIRTDDEVFLEIDGPNGLKSLPLREGFAYSWNTQLPHRVIPSPARKAASINLVLGFSPWISISMSRRQMCKNSHFGRKFSDILKGNLDLSFLKLKGLL